MLEVSQRRVTFPIIRSLPFHFILIASLFQIDKIRFFFHGFQVLPDDMVVLAEPDPNDMVRAIEKAISILPSINPEEMHNRVSSASNPSLTYQFTYKS